MALNTFLECTGSVVGWYGLLAPEIIEVLEASPSKPSVSSLFLMLSSFISTSRPDIRAGSGLKWTAVPWSSENSQAENNVSTKNNPRYKTITVNSSRVYDLQIPSPNTTSTSPAPLLPSRCARILLGTVLNDLEWSRLLSWQCPYFTASGCRM